jgi:hypoxanthine phosphoribosyltransferase
MMMKKELIYRKIDILHKIRSIQKQISDKFWKKEPIFLVVLGGAVMFASHVIPTNFLCQTEYIKISSYQGTERKELQLVYEPTLDMQGKDIIIIEDIVDSGTTIEYLHVYLNSKDVKSINVVSLFYKESSKHLVDFGGFEIDEKSFVIGFGMDYNGYYRNYPNIYKLT